MKVLVVNSRKGGVGKTTLCGHLGVGFTQRGFVTVLVDTDPHAGLTEWWQDRQAEDLQLLAVSFDALAASLDLLRAAGVDFVIIDTPPQAGKGIEKLFDLADLVVIPSKASRHDLRATRKTVDLVKASRTPMVFVLNEVRPRTRIEGEAVVAIARHGRLAPIIHYRQDIVTGMIDGRTIQEISPSSPGADEINELCDDLLTELGAPPPKKAPPPSGRRARKQPITEASNYVAGDTK